jgi:hypothetical protein
LTPAERFAARIGRPVADVEHAIGVVRGQLSYMIAAGKIVRKDGERGLPSDDEIVAELETARAFIDTKNEIADVAASVRAAVYTDGRVPVPEIPRRARGRLVR